MNEDKPDYQEYVLAIREPGYLNAFSDPMPERIAIKPMLNFFQATIPADVTEYTFDGSFGRPGFQDGCPPGFAAQFVPPGMPGSTPVRAMNGVLVPVASSAVAVRCLLQSSGTAERIQQDSASASEEFWMDLGAFTAPLGDAAASLTKVGVAALVVGGLFLLVSQRRSNPRVLQGYSSSRSNPRPRAFPKRFERAGKGMLSLREAQQRLRKHGIKLTKNSYGEYEVKPSNVYADHGTYHTDSLDDAWSTGIFISRNKKGLKTRRKPNPPAVVGEIPGQIETIDYQRTGPNPGPYRHTFTSPSRMLALRDGSVLIKPGSRKKLWGRY